MFDYIRSGEWSYKKYKAGYHDKFNREIDIFENYICQIPYFKIIGVPIGFIMLIAEWLPVIIYVIVVDSVYFQKIKKFFTKGKS